MDSIVICPTEHYIKTGQFLGELCVDAEHVRGPGASRKMVRDVLGAWDACG